MVTVCQRWALRYFKSINLYSILIDHQFRNFRKKYRYRFEYQAFKIVTVFKNTHFNRKNIFALGPELHLDTCTVLHYRGLCCIWKCLLLRGLCCFWTCLRYRDLCCTPTCPHKGLSLTWPFLVFTLQTPVLYLNVSTPQGSELH
jgi:hypothetical protein